MKNVVAYVRVSTDNQCGEDKFGLDVQREQIEKYCAEHDMQIAKWYHDDGESGAKERPGFDEIVYGEVANPPVEAVVVAKTDRVARDINVYYYYKMLLMKKNIELISIAEDFGQMGVFAAMLEAFTICCAQMERDNITKRTSASRALKARSGGYSGGRTPYGYIARDHKLVIDEKQAEVVRVIFRMKDDEKKTYREVVEHLNASEFLTKSGKPFMISTVQTIYENKNMYLGKYRYGKSDEWIDGQHEPILK